MLSGTCLYCYDRCNIFFLKCAKGSCEYILIKNFNVVKKTFECMIFPPQGISFCKTVLMLSSVSVWQYESRLYWLETVIKDFNSLLLVIIIWKNWHTSFKNFNKWFWGISLTKMVNKTFRKEVFVKGLLVILFLPTELPFCLYLFSHLISL